MKKWLLFIFCSLLLFGCATNNQNAQDNSNNQNENSTTEDSSATDNKNDAENDYPEDMIILKKGESEQFSGTIVFGEDLEPGRYNITLPNPEGSEDDNVAFHLYEDEKAYEDGNYEHYWLFPKDEEHEADELINFRLKEGNIIKISGEGSLIFTRR